MYSRSHRTGLLIFLALVLLASLALPAVAHTERPAEFPDGSGSVPKYRPMIAEPNMVVCKADSKARIKKIPDAELRKINLELLKRCDYSNIQQAIDLIPNRGMTIYVLPGIYLEQPTRSVPKCAESLGPRPRTYEEQLACPAAENLISVMGDANPSDDKRECNVPQCDLQIEGTGDNPEDVIIRGGFDKDDQWLKLNGIRGDRSDGLYLKNFTIELFEFNAIYILETDGFVIDEVVSRHNDEYGFLTFAVDHGVYKNCESYGSADSAIYPGSASDLNADSTETGKLKRWSVEIFNCTAYWNALGYSGTAGNSVYVHDNHFYDNQTGIATDSLYPEHPGLPQDHGWFTNNYVHSNNVNFHELYIQSGICDKPPGQRGYGDPKKWQKWDGVPVPVVCPAPPLPVGTGMVIAGGNYNYLHQNYFWDNWRNGFMQIGVPAPLRNETDPNKAFDTSHFNAYVANTMGITPGGKIDPNGIDFWWDDQGEGNCWEKNTSSYDTPTSNTLYPMGLPTCESGGSYGFPMAPQQVPLIPCATYNREDNQNPPGCDWFETPEEPQP
jgi:hypothetical protein